MEGILNEYGTLHSFQTPTAEKYSCGLSNCYVDCSAGSWTTLRGAHVGMNIEEIKKLYGPPSSDFDGFLFYYNDDFDELEICFYFESKGIIQRIVLSMGT